MVRRVSSVCRWGLKHTSCVIGPDMASGDLSSHRKYKAQWNGTRGQHRMSDFHRGRGFYTIVWIWLLLVHTCSKIRCLRGLYTRIGALYPFHQKPYTFICSVPPHYLCSA